MATIVNPYDNLYTNLKNKFTVVSGSCEYTVGDYMLMKAGKDKSNNTALTVTISENKAITSVINFVNNKLTAKTPAKKEKTIKKFPLRTSFSAALSAVAACALVLSCGIFSLVGKSNTSPLSAEVSITEEQENINENPSIEKTENVG